MRVAALYDIHGNLPALEAVLEEVEGVDAVVVGGDVASGPMPAETLGALRSMGDRVHFVRGNADRVLDLDGIPEPNRSARRWVAEQLGEEALAFLANLPLGLALDVDGLGAVRFCHGAPGSDETTITAVTSDDRLRRLLAGMEEDIVVCGHTHIQFDRWLDVTGAARTRRSAPPLAGEPPGSPPSTPSRATHETTASSSRGLPADGWIRVLNAGSVGAPYEAEPAAYWLELGPEVRFRRTDYDIEAALEQMRATGYPNLEPSLEYLSPDPDRPDRMSALIEEQWG